MFAAGFFDVSAPVIEILEAQCWNSGYKVEDRLDAKRWVEYGRMQEPSVSVSRTIVASSASAGASAKY